MAGFAFQGVLPEIGAGLRGGTRPAREASVEAGNVGEARPFSFALRRRGASRIEEGRAMRALMGRGAVAVLLGTMLASAAVAGPMRAGDSFYAGPAVPAVGGQAPWSAPWEYDSGSGNDRRPELPYYQGRGQQTGGLARNLLPDDGLHLFPR
jgi:hypothetical protein